jgi:hypothetical protein
MPESKAKEVCSECGKSVQFGSGKFVNRVPDFNTPVERKLLGRPYPEGDFICATCDSRYDEGTLKIKSS